MFQFNVAVGKPHQHVVTCTTKIALILFAGNPPYNLTLDDIYISHILQFLYTPNHNDDSISQQYINKKGH